jgi:hypothetical protein
MKSGKKWQSRIFIVLAGVALGYLARFVWPPVVRNTLPTREFSEPLEDVPIRELPILPVDEDSEFPFPLDQLEIR